MQNDYLELTQVGIVFPTPNGPFTALRDVDLKIAKGEFVSLIGHSGCGKSTVLNIVAGLHQATTGGVILDGKEVDEPGPDRAVVFQNHSLLPWLTAYENVELAVKQVFKGRKTKAEIAEWIKHNLELVHMEHAMDKRPHEISGGMKQRVGIARALAMEPKVLLMDEPFGALDALTRAHMQDSLMEIQARLNNTVIMITHDVDEAVLLSDRIVMMTNGPAATVGEILKVELPRPRERLALADDPQYNHYRAEVLHFLHERHKRSEIPVRTTSVAVETKPAANLEKTDLTLGFIPLTDCAPLVVAKEKGLFAKHGLNVTLSREASWASIRDKVAAGVLDGAHMLAGMALVSPLRSGLPPLVTALSLDLNGNAITVSNELYASLAESGVEGFDTTRFSAAALKRVIDANNAAGKLPLTFAMVFPESSHNYLLRYWMASAGIDPDKDVRLIVIPPQKMAEALANGDISGYCAGEPWNALAVEQGIGHVLLTSYDIWQNHPEKVFGVTRQWADANPETHLALISALLEACRWLDDNENRAAACEMLSRAEYVDAPQDVLQASLLGTCKNSRDASPRACRDFNVFHRYAANFPWRSHALWLLSQMLRWGHIGEADLHRVANDVYRPEIYRQAAAQLGIAAPSEDLKREGDHAGVWVWQDGEVAIEMGADRFIDDFIFDPLDIDGYLSRLMAESAGVTSSAFAAQQRKVG